MAVRTVTLLLCLALSACGQKGPLYFADEKAPAQTPEKAQQQTDREEDEQQ